MKKAIACLTLVLLGQQGVIRGRVLNKATNEAVPYTTVAISGIRYGNTSNNFVIAEVKVNKRLFFCFYKNFSR